MCALVTLAGCFQDSPPASMPGEDAGSVADVPVDQGAPPVDTGSPDTGVADTGVADAGGGDTGSGDDAGKDAGPVDTAPASDAGCTELTPCLDAGPTDSGPRPDVGPDDAGASGDAGQDAGVLVDSSMGDVGGGLDVPLVPDVPQVPDVPAAPDVLRVPRRAATVLTLSSGGGETRSAGYALHVEVMYGAPAEGRALGTSQRLYTAVVSRP